MKTNERQPLIRHGEDSNDFPIIVKTGRSLRLWSLLPKIHVTEPRFRYLPLIGCLLVLVNEGEYFFKQIGYYRAVEALYCIEHFQIVDPNIARLGRRIPEHLCKLDPIQKKVATTNGIIMLVRMTASFLGTIPLGYLADRIGRRFAIIMHKIGTLFYTLCVLVTYLGYPSVPIWVSYLGGLGGLIGANFDLNLSVMLASYTDAMTDNQQRSTYFFITTSMQYVGQIAFPLAAGQAINLDGHGGTSEVSLCISVGMAFIGFVVAIFLWPETMKKDETSAETLIGSSSRHAGDEDMKSENAGFMTILATNLKALWSNFQHSVRGIGTLNLGLLAVAIFLATTAIKAVDWLGLIQYPVIKFGWQYNQSTFAMAIQAAVYIFTYFVLLPGYNKLGVRLGLSTSSTSLIIMLISLVFLEAGAIFLGLSAVAAQFIAATCLYTLGAGMPSVMQAYIANLVEKSGLGKLLAIISLFQVAGKVTASGIGPLIIKAGIDSHHERLKGSIFIFAALVFLLSAVALGIVMLRVSVTRNAVEEVLEEAREEA